MKRPQEFLTSTQLAARWQVTIGALKKWRVEKRGPRYVKLGRRRVLYRLADVAAYERRMTRRGT